MPLRWVPPGTPVERRRASEEYGGKRPRKPKAPDRRTPWQRHMDRHRRVWGATRKHYRKHKHKRGSIALWGGLAGLGVLTGMWLFQGTSSLLAFGVAGGAVVGGAIVERRDYAKTMRGTRNATDEDRARVRHAWTQPHQRRRPPAEPEAPETGRVHVRSHRNDGDQVRSHTRARPGQGNGEAPGGGWSAADTKANPESKAQPSSPRPSTTSPRPTASPSSGPGRKPRRPARKRGASGRVLHQTESPNSAEDPADLRRQGKCEDCGDRGLWNEHGHPGEWHHTYCQTCGA